MKQFRLTSLLLLMLATFTLISCDKDDDFDDLGITENVISFAGTTTKITRAAQVYYGDYSGSGLDNVDLSFLAGDKILDLELFLPLGNTHLKEGTYTYNSGKKEMSFRGELETSDDEWDITSGTVKISEDSGTYAIIIDVVCENGEKLTATYKGKLEYYSEDED